MEQDKALTAGKVQKVLDWAYDKAVNGVTGLDSAQDIAKSYIKKGGNQVDCVNALIRWQNTKAGTRSAIRSVSGEVIKTINRAVGFRLLTKFGQKGSINLVKLVPLAGGIVGGTLDSISTNIIGNIARQMFIMHETSLIPDEVTPPEI